MPTVLLAHRHLSFLIPRLSRDYRVLIGWEGWTFEPDEVEAVVVAGEVPLDDALLRRLVNLKLIACFTVGYDGIDVASARKRGVQVSHAVGVNDEDVADHAIGLLISHRRAIVSGDRLVRHGGWDSGPKRLTRSLTGSTIGIVGMGRIGMAVARRADAMAVSVRWWGPNPKPEAPWPRSTSLILLAAASDVLVVAAAATPDNVAMIDAEVLNALGPDGLLINVARGSLVDEEALIEALRHGHLGGAGLDVFSTEPTPADRWQDVPNLVVTPHSAGATHRAVELMTDQLLGNLSALFAGEPLHTPVH